MNPVQDPTQLVMLDGQPIPAHGPALSADLPGILRGEGIFETFLVRDGAPSPWLAQHDARLCHSAELTGFQVQPGDLERGYREFATQLDVAHWRVRLTILRGLEGRQHFLWTAGPEPQQRASVVLQVSDFRLDPLDPIAGAKTISRIGLQVARNRAQKAGAFDALLTTIDGDLAEGTSSNIFLWMDGGLHTPGLDRGILGGVTRQAVLEACRRAGIPVFERRIGLDELKSAVEVYVTNAVIGVTPVASILEWRESLPGPRGEALQEIRSAYQALLATVTSH
ncbi:MAG: aminotransferase class IV [Planctomycetota bacterium]|jgi:branched-subunit amino acid aminotransferase/4-amino-4-deoxychorismate lyase